MNIPRNGVIRGPPSLSQAMELVSGHATVGTDGLDNDVTNYLLPTVSGHGHIAGRADEPVPEADGCGSGTTRKKF